MLLLLVSCAFLGLIQGFEKECQCTIQENAKVAPKCGIMQDGVCVRPATPTEWICPEELWADGVCHCGICGAVDVDCTVGDAYVSGCSSSDACCAIEGPAGTCGVKSNDQCVVSVSRTCVDRVTNGIPERSSTGVACHCDESCKMFGDCCDDYEEAEPRLRALRAPMEARAVQPAVVPCGVTGTCSTGCYASLVGNGVCDTDCNNAACKFDNGDCAGYAPAGWLCEAVRYGDGNCDCGAQCGIIDSDCITATTNDPVFGCPWEGSNQKACCQNNNGVGVCAIVSGNTCSRGTQPTSWFCSLSQWTDDVCDCECGSYDPACQVATANVTGCGVQRTDAPLCCSDVGGFGSCSARSADGTCPAPVPPINLAVPAGSLVLQYALVVSPGSPAAGPAVRTYSVVLTVQVSGQTIASYGLGYQVQIVWTNEFGTTVNNVFNTTITSASDSTFNAIETIAGNSISVSVVVDPRLSIDEGTRSDNAILGKVNWAPTVELVYPLTNGGLIPIGVGPQINTYLALIPKQTSIDLLPINVTQVGFYVVIGNDTADYTHFPRVCWVNQNQAYTYANRQAFPCTFDVIPFINQTQQNNQTASALNYVVAVAWAGSYTSNPASYELKPLFLPPGISEFWNANATTPTSTTDQPAVSGDELIETMGARGAMFGQADDESFAADEELMKREMHTRYPSTQTYSFEIFGVDFPGNDITSSYQTTFEDCMKFCAATSGCYLTTWSAGAPWCWAKSAMTGFNSYLGYGSGDVYTGLMAPYNQFQLLPNVQLNGADLYSLNTGNVKVCMDNCLSNNFCGSFFWDKPSGNCYLKTYTVEAQNWNLGSGGNYLSALRRPSSGETSFLPGQVFTSGTVVTYSNQNPSQCQTSCGSHLIFESWPATGACYCKNFIRFDQTASQAQAVTGYPMWPLKSVLPTSSLYYSSLLVHTSTQSHQWVMIFEGDNNAYQMNTCQTGTTIDTYINVYRSSSGSLYSLTLVTSDDDGCGNQGASASFCAVSGYYYWVLLSTSGTYVSRVNIANFGFAVNKGSSCSGTTSNSASGCYSTSGNSGCATPSGSYALQGNVFSTLSGVLSMVDCCGRCSALYYCEGYRYYSSNQQCSLINTLTDGTASSGAVSAVIYGYCKSSQIFQDTAISGDNAFVATGITNMNACCAQCTNYAGCVGWTYTRGGGSCYLKTEISGVTTNSGFVSGVVGGTGFRTYLGSSLSNANSLSSGNSGSYSACLASCQSTSGCQSYTYKTNVLTVSLSCISFFGARLCFPTGFSTVKACYLYSNLGTPQSDQAATSGVVSQQTSWSTLSTACGSGSTICPINGLGCGNNIPEVDAATLSGSTETLLVTPGTDQYGFLGSCRYVSKPIASGAHDKSALSVAYYNFVNSNTRSKQVCCCPTTVLNNPVTQVASTPTCYENSFTFSLTGSGKEDAQPKAASGTLKFDTTVILDIKVCTSGSVDIAITGSGSAPILDTPVILTILVKGRASGIVSGSGWSFTSASALLAGIISVSASGAYHVGVDICCSCCYADVSYDAYLSVFVNVNMYFTACTGGISNLCFFGLKPTQPLQIVVGAAAGLSGSLSILKMVTVTASADAHIYAGFDVSVWQPSFSFSAWEMTGQASISGCGAYPCPHWHWPWDTCSFCVGASWGNGLGSNQGWFNGLPEIVFRPPGKRDVLALPGGEPMAPVSTDPEVDGALARAAHKRKPASAPVRRTLRSADSVDVGVETMGSTHKGVKNERTHYNPQPQEFMMKPGKTLRDTLHRDFTPIQPCWPIINQDFVIQGIYDASQPSLAALNDGSLVFCYPIAINSTKGIGNPESYASNEDTLCSYYNGAHWSLPTSPTSGAQVPVIFGDLISRSDGNEAIGAFIVPGMVPFMKNLTNQTVAEEVINSFQLVISTFTTASSWSTYTATTKGPRIAAVRWAAQSPAQTVDVLFGAERVQYLIAEDFLLSASNNTNITIWAIALDGFSKAAWPTQQAVTITSGVGVDPSSLTGAVSTTRVVVFYQDLNGNTWFQSAATAAGPWTAPFLVGSSLSYIDVAARSESQFVVTWGSGGNTTFACGFDGIDFNLCDPVSFMTNEMNNAIPDVRTDQNVIWKQSNPQVIALNSGAVAVVWGEASQSWGSIPLIRWSLLPAGAGTTLLNSTYWGLPTNEPTTRAAPVKHLHVASRVWTSNSFWVMDTEHNVQLTGIPDIGPVPPTYATVNGVNQSYVITNVFAMQLNLLPIVRIDNVVFISSLNAIRVDVSNHGVAPSGAISVWLSAGDSRGPRTPLPISTTGVALNPRGSSSFVLALTDANANATQLAALQYGYVWASVQDAAATGCAGQPPTTVAIITGSAALSNLVLEGAGDGSIRACAKLATQGIVPDSLPVSLTAVSTLNATYNGTTVKEHQRFTIGTGFSNARPGSGAGVACVDITGWVGNFQAIAPPLELSISLPPNIIPPASTSQLVLLYPDLVLQSFDVSVVLAVTGYLQARLVVHNTGGMAACSPIVEAYMGAVNPSHLIQTTTVTSVLGYSSTTLLFTIQNAAFVSGLNTTFTFFVNHDLSVFEVTLSNNAARVPVAFTGAANIVIAASGVVVNGNTVQVTATNTGDGVAVMVPFFVGSAQIAGAPGVISSSVTIAAIPPGGSVTVTLPLTCPSCPKNGTVSVAISVDPSFTVTNLLPYTPRVYNVSLDIAAAPSPPSPQSGSSAASAVTTPTPSGPLSTAYIIITVIGAVAGLILLIVIIILAVRFCRRASPKQKDVSGFTSDYSRAGSGSYRGSTSSTSKPYSGYGSRAYSGTKSGSGAPGSSAAPSGAASAAPSGASGSAAKSGSGSPAKSGSGSGAKSGSGSGTKSGSVAKSGSGSGS